jgi:hypothetical protein
LAGPAGDADLEVVASREDLRHSTLLAAGADVVNLPRKLPTRVKVSRLDVNPPQSSSSSSPPSSSLDTPTPTSRELQCDEFNFMLNLPALPPE